MARNSKVGLVPEENPYDVLGSKKDISFFDWLISKESERENIANINRRLSGNNNSSSPVAPTSNVVPVINSASPDQIAINNRPSFVPPNQIINKDLYSSPESINNSTKVALNNLRSPVDNSLINANIQREQAIANIKAKSNGKVNTKALTDKEQAILNLQKQLGPKATESMPKDFFISSDNRPGQSQTETSLVAPKSRHKQNLAMLEPEYVNDEDFMITY